MKYCRIRSRQELGSNTKKVDEIVDWNKNKPQHQSYLNMKEDEILKLIKY